jgi:hypothetical protein
VRYRENCAARRKMTGEDERTTGNLVANRKVETTLLRPLAFGVVLSSTLRASLLLDVASPTDMPNPDPSSPHSWASLANRNPVHPLPALLPPSARCPARPLLHYRPPRRLPRCAHHLLPRGALLLLGPEPYPRRAVVLALGLAPRRRDREAR